MSALRRLVGWALIAVPLVPLWLLFGAIPGDRDVASLTEWLLGISIFLPVAWLIAMLVPRADSLGRSADTWVGKVRPRVWYLGLATIILGLAAFASAGIFEHQPLSIDSIVQLFQARIFETGVLAAPEPPPGGAFATQHMLVDERGWYSQYPPGNSALLALGGPGREWVVPILLTALTAVFVFRFTDRAYGRTTAVLAGVLLALSPFFWIMGASYMNHVPTLFFVALALMLFGEWEIGRGSGWLLLAGLSLGAAALSRPLTAGALTLVFAAWVLPSAIRERRARYLVIPAIGFLIVAVLYPLFNAATTGDPMLPGYLKLWGGSHGLGFHESPWGDRHTPLTGFRNELVDLSLLSLFLFEWPIPALAFLGALFAFGWDRPGWDRRLLAGFLAVPAAYFFYWHRDGYLGPRFLYSTLAFAVPLTARAIVVGADELRTRSFQIAGLFRPVSGRTLLIVLVGLCGLYGAAFGIPRRFRAHASSMASMKVDILAEARAAGIDRGLVFVAVSWGNRLISTAQGTGAPLSLVQKAYRGSDHCELDSVLSLASAAGWDADDVAVALEGLISADHELVQPSLNADPSLRLREGGRLQGRCADQIQYDLQGYTIYAPHLLANPPALDGPIVVARDLREQNAALRARYPDRPAWLYRPGGFTRLW